MAPPAAQGAKAAYGAFRELHGVVISAGLMDKTVRVRVGGQKWNSFVKKFFDDPKTHAVHDPNNSLRTGDVVAITPGWRVSKSKRHVVKHIIAPGSGVPIESREPIPSEAERHAERDALRLAKDQRRVVKKLADKAEAKMGVVETMIRRTRKEIALRGRLMGSEPEGEQAVGAKAEQ
ncbi:hypothetical protein C8A00DRAFT_12646 [Chaetomidium leptoderma]|uniref:Ribosomal protein S17 n=1 Tax=Chaetomidium leptoderma TaxID=669021 RepID=A0AAN6VS70_9PEZI|nr:hypothetical protein C8A00DRAFT_12646 [Chaetomidium leptoderma]